MAAVILDGDSLTIEQLVAVSRDGAEVRRDPATDERVRTSEALIASVVDNYRKAWKAGSAVPSEYGVTTGFGEFKDKPIAPDDLEQLQRNLLLSHTVGVGDNTDPDDLRNYFSAEVVRGALVTRLNAFLKGHSGVRHKLVEIVEAMLNRHVIPLVPLRGSVGASGDLCPLSHLFVVLLGVGRFQHEGKIRPAGDLPSLLGFSAEEMKPTFKEGLALVNGANFSAALLSLAVHDAARLAEVADACAALTMEAVCGCSRALDAKISIVPHIPDSSRRLLKVAEAMRAPVAEVAAPRVARPPDGGLSLRAGHVRRRDVVLEWRSPSRDSAHRRLFRGRSGDRRAHKRRTWKTYGTGGSLCPILESGAVKRERKRREVRWS